MPAKISSMNRKPSPWIISCLTVLLFIGFPSCDGPDYAAIRGIDRIEVTDADNMIIDHGDTTISDTIVLQVYPVLEYFAQNVGGSMASAWALSPPDPWMANELVDIRVYCDKTIYGLPPGENLSPSLQFGYSANLSQYLDELPGKGDEAYRFDPITIFLTSKPAPDAYTFTVEMEDNNGHVFISSSTAFRWQ